MQVHWWLQALTKQLTKKKVRIWTCFLCSNWDPRTLLEDKGTGSEEGASTHFPRAAEPRGGNLVTCCCITCPRPLSTSGQSLPLHLQVSTLKERKRLPETLLIISLSPLEACVLNEFPLLLSGLHPSQIHLLKKSTSHIIDLYGLTSNLATT